MSEAIKKITIGALPSSSIHDEDIFIKSNHIETSKITAKDISEYINENSNAEANVQSDWNETDMESDAFILNKPLSLPASDVHEWAKSETKPIYTASEVGADESGSSNAALENAKIYTDTKIADLINGAPTTLDTLGEIAQAMQENEDVVTALDIAIGSKAAQAELETHTEDSTIHVTAADKEKWNGISAMTQNIKAIQVVSALPSDAASHTDTLYLITE